ncbi:MAG: hypothetical protein IPP77_05940 [Bacteroidetes bacterium]|nr:hypothetical protein [Bacteroidota bacterium]
MELVKDIQIFYFWDVNSGELSPTFNRIKEVFSNTQLLKFNFLEYDKAYKEVESFLRNQTLDDLQTVFIGSGLGGYWANLFCSVFGIQTILINPSLRPSDISIRIYPRVVFIGLQDKVVNYQETKKVLGNNARFIFLPYEGHELKNVQPVLDLIPKFVNTVSG